jgi:cytochrome c-type biogenesis protein
MDINVWIAFWAGLASFISPCCLPLYPSYISYITGISVSRLKNDTNKAVRFRTMMHTLFFILGFSIVYYTIGIFSGLIAETFSDYSDLLSKIAAILIIVMGLFMLGIFKPQLLMREFKFKWNFKPLGYFGSLLIGIGFAAGWSPCVGPILSSIVALAATEQGIWFKLITAYTLGFAIPFFVMAFFIGSTGWILKYSNLIMKIGGAVMILVGILLYTGQMYKITIWLQSITPQWLQF